MGNGFTWELESLIFWAIAVILCEEDVCYSADDVSVYGDDITLPSSLSSRYADVCSLLGFKVNQSKSFSTGYFRESCGDYYYAGVNINPFYFRNPVSDLVSLYDTANRSRLRRYADGSTVSLAESRASWLWLTRDMHACFTDVPPLIVPDTGLVGLVDTFDVAVPSRSWRYDSGHREVLNSYSSTHIFRRTSTGKVRWAVVWKEGKPVERRRICHGLLYKVYQLVEVPINLVYDGHGLLLERLVSIGRGEREQGNLIPDGARCRTVVRPAVTAWVEPGPWIVTQG